MLFLGLLVAAVVRLFGRGGVGPPPSRAALIGRRLLLGAAICYLGFAVALGVLMSDPIALFSGHLAGVEIALGLPVIGAGLTVGAAWSAVLQWKTGAGSIGARLWTSAQVATALLFLWSLNYWNLLGWRM